MTKKERLVRILEHFSNEERQTLESLGRNRLYSLLDMEHDDDMLVVMLKSIISQIAENVEQEKQEKKAVAREKARARVKITALKQVKACEPVEIVVHKFGMFTIPSEIFNLFCSEFNFNPNEAKRKIVNLYTYFPKRTPLVSLNITMDSHQLEWLLIDTLGEYYLLPSDQRNYSTFCGLFSKEVYSFLESIGNRTIRRKAEKARTPSDCYVYDSEGKLIRVIEGKPKKGEKKEGKKDEFTHISNQSLSISLEELKEKELDKLTEEELEELFQS